MILEKEGASRAVFEKGEGLLYELDGSSIRVTREAGANKSASLA